MGTLEFPGKCGVKPTEPNEPSQRPPVPLASGLCGVHTAGGTPTRINRRVNGNVPRGTLEVSERLFFFFFLVRRRYLQLCLLNQLVASTITESLISHQLVVEGHFPDPVSWFVVQSFVYHCSSTAI